MSDFGDQLGAQLVGGDELGGVATTATAAPVVGDCPEGCGWTLPPGTGNPNRDLAAHRKNKHGVMGQSRWSDGGKRKRGTKVPRDTAPSSVRVELKAGTSRGPKSDPALERVQQRAEQLASAVAVILLLSQQQADAADVERGKAAWATAVRDVAQHEEWLRKALATGGESSDRAVAWLKLLVASGAIALPIMARHGMVPPQLAALLALAPNMPPAPADDADAAVPAAA